jgi:hypothetical protein
MEQVQEKPIIMTQKKKGKRSYKKGDVIVMEERRVVEVTRGRPNMFTPELGEKICELIASGSSLRAIAKMEDMPAPSTVCTWLLDTEDLEKKAFYEQYTRAREIRADLMFEEMLEIADDGTNDWMEVERRDGSTFEMLNKEAVMRSRLRFDARRWVLSKMSPKKYGDKLDLTSKGGKIQSNAITFVNFSEEDDAEDK